MLECCHGPGVKLFVVHRMKNVSYRNAVSEQRPDDKTVVRRCITSLVSSPTYVLFYNELLQD